MSLNAAVVGGGISGLASALRLAGLGHHITLYESESFLGGLATTFPYREGHLERFYHCILPSDRALIAWVRELGLESELLWRRTRMGFLYRRKTYSLNTAFDLLRFSPLTLLERLRMGWLGMRVRRNGLDSELDQVTAAAWLRDQAGERAFHILWEPLLAAKMGDRYSSLPALWLSSRMKREKNTGPEVRGCMRYGYRSLIDAFERHLRERNAHIRLGARVREIVRDGERMALHLEDGSSECFDLVVATSPLIQFQRMTRTLALDARFTALELDYQGVISAVFLLERPLTPYYWMPFVDSDTVAQGVIEMTNLVPLERSHGLHVAYLVNYTHRDSELYRKSEDELLELYTRDLAALFPEAAQAIVDRFLFRAPFVEPVWTLDYAHRLPPFSVIPGKLYLASTAQLYPRVNSWNACCELVETMIPHIVAETAGAHSDIPVST
jgi:protoporphyrinogen oxidase